MEIKFHFTPNCITFTPRGEILFLEKNILLKNYFTNVQSHPKIIAKMQINDLYEVIKMKKKQRRFRSNMFNRVARRHVHYIGDIKLPLSMQTAKFICFGRPLICSPERAQISFGMLLKFAIFSETF